MTDDLPEKKQNVMLESRYDRGGPGRPPSIPLTPENEMVEEIMRRRNRKIKKDELREQISQDPDSLDVLDDLMEELAVEVAGLEFDRKEQIRKGQNDDPIYSSKRVTALKSIGDMFFKKRDMLLDETFDFESEKFEKLFEFWINKFRAAAEAVLSEEQIELFFQEVQEEFEDWEDEAKQYIKSGL